MKRVLLASVACLGLALAAPASAQAPVIDVGSITARALEAGRALLQMQQQWGTMKQQYAGIMQTVSSLQHPTQVLQRVPGLLRQQIQSPGSTPAGIPGLAFGKQLSAGAARFLDQNRYYKPEGDDFAAQEMRRKAQATANIQAEAQAGMERAEERIIYLNQLQQSIEEQPDVTAVSAVEAQIGNQNAFLQNEANNVARLQLIQQTQMQVDQQRAEQAGRKDADDWHERAAAVAFDGE